VSIQNPADFENLVHETTPKGRPPWSYQAAASSRGVFERNDPRFAALNLGEANTRLRPPGLLPLLAGRATPEMQAPKRARTRGSTRCPGPRR
jgi:hypothetical protein